MRHSSMTSADKLQWPQGNPLFETSWRAISEALAGNGILSEGDLEVSPTSNTREIEVAAGGVWYDGAEATLSGAATETVSAGDGTRDRWDLVAFDTDAESVVVREGTPGVNPEPPDIEGDEILLAVVYIPAEFDGVIPDSSVHNWRTMHQPAAQVRLADSPGNYDAEEVEAAFAEAFDVFLNEDGGTLNGPLDLSDFSGSAPLDLGEDPGTFGAIVDADVTDGGTHSYTLSINDTALITMEAVGDGAGGLSSITVTLGGTADVDGNNVEDAGTVIWDTSEGEIPAGVRTDMAVEDLTAEEGTITIWDQSQGLVPRNQVDRRLLANTITSDYTTDGEELILADPTGGAITLTLATADVDEGAGVQVVDISGAAASNPITVETEGGESIDGESTFTVDTEYGGVAVRSDGTDWYTAGGGTGGADADPANIFEGREGGEVAAGDQGVVVIDNLADGETVEIYKAALVTATVEAAPTDVDLDLVTFDNAGAFTSQTTLISGDGSTVYDRETGDPLGSYTNSSGGEQSIGVIVDNQTGGSEDVFAEVEGATNV